ncbi:sulfatase family protein [Pontiella sulfatireligans]|uniref:Arylsulfatase n=1 Tax=Pontiella sulfatireligans TaxID=2750658 RepID=A0A6C2UIE6_9BACT|nr:sulfatase [Pontiella sulfatireligans]SPS74371.1 sulfatase S1_25 [Kiritimatiellales bacterium]VGO19643.1 Arylsulfatase [Pontiella sulfatireligans]
MNRRSFLGGAAVGGTVCATRSAWAADKKRPNVILLLTDDQSYRTMGCYGNPQAKTPNLDRLAAEGVVFDRAYDTTAICMASRAQVMTGMYEYKTGCNFQHGPLTADKWQKSYPVLMRDAGYHTGFVGKFGFAVKPTADGSSNYHSNEDLPMDSFDEWYGWPAQGQYRTADNEFVAQYAEKYPHVTRACGAVSQDFIKNAAKSEEPFCLSVSFKASHGPMSPDKFFNDVYADTVWEEPPNYDEAGASLKPPQAKGGRQYMSIKDFRPDKYQETMRKYNQLVYGIDYAVGMIREELERQGVADNTVILFLTDNGYSCGANGMGGKVLPYEEPSRSPMIVYDPRHPVSGKGARVQSVTANIDMAPTVLDVAGLPIPGNMDGKSLMPLLDNPKGKVHDSILLINAWGSAPTHSLAVVTEDYKYIHWPFNHEMQVAEELYDLGKDRYEMNNLAANPEKQEILKRMQKQYDESFAAWKKECIDYGNYPLFSKIYDRHIAWDDKLAAMDSRTRRNYQEWNQEKPKKEESPEKKAAKAAARAKRKAEQANNH